jgi:hypothetical protein
MLCLFAIENNINNLTQNNFKKYLYVVLRIFMKLYV